VYSDSLHLILKVLFEAYRGRLVRAEAVAGSGVVKFEADRGLCGYYGMVFL